MGRIATGATLVLFGLPLILVSVFVDAAGSGDGSHAFGLEQKAGVVIGCVAMWLACVAASGWRPRNPSYARAADAVEAAVGRASRTTWIELSQTQTVRGLGALQALVILVTTLGLLVLTSTPWYVALIAGIVVSLVVNALLLRRNRSTLSRERRRR